MILCSPSPGVYEYRGEAREAWLYRDRVARGERDEKVNESGGDWTDDLGMRLCRGVGRSWTHLVPGEDHGALLPAGVCGDLASHEVLQVSMQLGHETRAGRDAVRVETFRLWQLLAFLQGLTNQFLCIAC